MYVKKTIDKLFFNLYIGMTFKVYNPKIQALSIMHWSYSFHKSNLKLS